MDNETEETEAQHDDECAEQIRYTGACRHGHAFSGPCGRANCPLDH